MIDSMCQQNDRAARLLELGQLEEATKILSGTLQSLDTVVEGAGGSIRTLNAHYMARSQIETSHTMPLSPSSMKAIAWRSALSSDEDNDFIYRSPILSTGLPKDEVLDAYALGIVVVFNLALSHHLQALRDESGIPTKPSTMAHLNAALRMYELTFNMQLKGDCILHVAEILALVNNCGQIHKLMNRQLKAQWYFQHMMSALLVLIENGEASAIGDQHMEGFIRNASRLILRAPVAAPAA